MFFLFAFVVIGLLKVPSAHAAAPYRASDVLGQTNPVTGEVNFSTSVANNNNVDTGPGSSTSFNWPEATAIDVANHRLFVADTYNHRVLVYVLNDTNDPTSADPSYVLGQPDFASTDPDISPNAKGFYYPRGLTYDPNHDRLFVADTWNSRILVFDVAAITNNEPAVNVLGQLSFTSRDQRVSAEGLNFPDDVTYDAAHDRLFVADTESSRVLVFDATSITNYEQATHVLGQPNFNVYGGNSATSKTFERPRGLAYDPNHDRLFVPDGWNKRILVFDTTSITNYEDAVNVLGKPDFTSTAVSMINARDFSTPNTLTYDTANNRLFVGDDSRYRVLVFDATTITNYEDAVNVLGQPDFTNLYGGSQVGLVRGLSYDATNHRLFVADYSGNRIPVFDTTTITNGENALNVAGQLGFVSGGPDAGEPNATGLDTRYGGGTTLDALHHRLFVTDSYNGRILIFNLDEDNNLIDKTADNVLGSTNFTDRWDVDYPGYLGYPGTTTYDEVNNRLFVADLYDCRVMVFDLSDGITNGMDASHVIGQPDFETFDCGLGRGQFDYSEVGAIAFDSKAQMLYVTDSYTNYRLLAFEVAPDQITNGMDASYVIGAPDFDTAGNGGCGRNELGINWTSGLAVDPDHHRLFYADYDCGNVKVFDTSNLSNGMDASYVLGCDDLDCNDYSEGAASLGGVNGPEGLSYDPAQQLLFVNNYLCSTVSIFDIKQITNGEEAIGALGESAPGACDGEGTSQTELYANYGSDNAYDPVNRRLYFADDSNNRVMIFDFVKLTANTVASGVKGASYSQAIPVRGAQGTLRVEVTAGALPPGLTLNSETGVLSGKPTALGSYNFTLLATDDNDTAGTFTDTKSYTLTIIQPAAVTGEKNKPIATRNTMTKAPAADLAVSEAVAIDVPVTKDSQESESEQTSRSYVEPASNPGRAWLLGGVLVGLGSVMFIIQRLKRGGPGE